jgi:hypothetical protein
MADVKIDPRPLPAAVIRQLEELAETCVRNLNGEQWPDTGKWELRIVQVALEAAYRLAVQQTREADEDTAIELGRQMAGAAVAALMPQWQPIETAPKNGTSLILGAIGEKAVLGFWSQRRTYWLRLGAQVGAQAEDRIYPTHWMPLPDPPAAIRAASPTEKALQALTVIMEGFDSGVFVRNIDHDGEGGWAFRLLPYVQALATANALVQAAAIRAASPTEPG